MADKRILGDRPTVAELRAERDFRILAVPAAIAAVACVRESSSFEEAIRNAISIAADADTIGAITGSIAGPLYGIDESLIKFARGKLGSHLRGIVDLFSEKFSTSFTRGLQR